MLEMTPGHSVTYLGMPKEWFHRPASSQNKVVGSRSYPRRDGAESRNRPLRSTCCFWDEP